MYKSTIYNKNMNSFVRTYLIKGDHDNFLTPYQWECDHNNIVAEICESLLYYDRITFYLYGENLIVPFLINLFGIDGLRRLLDQDAIRFMFNVPEIMYPVDNIDGIIPLIGSCGFTSAVHSEPRASLEEGMSRYNKPIPRTEKRDLIAKIAKKYIVPDKEISNNAVDFGVDAYRRDIFADFGLPNVGDIEKLSLPQRKLLCGLTTEYIDVALLAKYKLYINKSFRTASLYEQSFRYLCGAEETEKSTNKLFKLEEIPDFRTMVKEKIIAPKDIILLREKSDSIKFRNWITETTGGCSSENISKAYIDAIYSCNNGLFNKEPYKFIKTVFMSIIGFLPGVSSVASIPLNFLDSYVLSNWNEGWSPKHFFEREMKPMIKTLNKNSQ